MPQRIHEWQARIKNVEAEWAVAHVAVARLLVDVAINPMILPSRDVRNVRTAASRLDGTYLIRLFAEFETGLRTFWRAIKSTHPQTQHLLNAVAGRRHIPEQIRANAQIVRRFRNHLVHERDEEVDAVPLPVARGYLCRYFSYLPPEW